MTQLRTFSTEANEWCVRDRLTPPSFKFDEKKLRQCFSSQDEPIKATCVGLFLRPMFVGFTLVSIYAWYEPWLELISPCLKVRKLGQAGTQEFKSPATFFLGLETGCDAKVI